MIWRLIGRCLRLAFLLRVPVSTLIILAVLGPLSLSSSLLGNLLDQESRPWYLFTVSFSAFTLAFAALAVMNLTLYYGSDRFDEGLVLGRAPKHPLLTFFLGCAAAAALVVCVYLRTIPVHALNLVWLVIGFLAAGAMVILAKVVQLALTDPKWTPHPPPYLVFPVHRFRRLDRFFTRIYCWSGKSPTFLKHVFNQFSQVPLSILQRSGQGYLVDLNPEPGEPLRLQSGHVFALSLSTLAFLSYVGIGIFKSRITDQRASVPALAFILLFLIVVCWALSALTFFFDRFRFPLLWTVMVLAAFTFAAPRTDNFFRVVTRQSPFDEPATAAGYLKKKLGPSRKRLILVATPGGGIQAAAWTAQVLTGLNQQDPHFRDSVAVISSVSGGSLGSMIYASSFAGKIAPDEVPMKARESAIDEIAWGLTVPDVWRSVAPWMVTNRAIDRGWALEKKWAAINKLNDTGEDQGTMLSDWSDAARNATMPALIINSMLVERGQPVVFSTTRFPKDPDPANRIVNFYDLYPDQYRMYDIRVNTAARLSASFPYVGPASRPDLKGPRAKSFHFVDGGYYDNFGITSLLAWLNEALSDAEVRGSMPDILILQIRHFNPNVIPGGSVQGWGFQTVAPGFALYHMRDFAQDSVARNQLEFFAKYYEKQNVRVWKTTISYNGKAGVCSAAPLSWKLDANQQQCITDTWTSVLKYQTEALACISSYLNGDNSAITCKKAADDKE